MANQLRHARQQAFTRQGGKCYYCGLPMWNTEPGGPWQLRCTAEHLTPRSEGGSNGQANIAAACAFCNHTRHKRKRPPDPLQYRNEIQRRVARGGWMPAHVLRWAQSLSASGNN